MTQGWNQTGVLFTRAYPERRRWPLRGILVSLLFHTAVLTGALSLPVLGVLADSRITEREAELDLSQVVYLPVLGSGSAASPVQSPVPDDSAAPSPTAGTSRSLPGPQPFLSDLSEPTNPTRTVLRPAVDPKAIEPPSDLANVVQLADQQPVIQAAPPAPESGSAAVEEPSRANEAPRAPEKLTMMMPARARADLQALAEDRGAAPLVQGLPTSFRLEPTPVPGPEDPGPATRELAVLDLSRAGDAAPLPSLEPQAPTAEFRPLDLPGPRLVAEVPTAGTSPEDLLVLSPTPGENVSEPPSGESRGLFAVSPSPNEGAEGPPAVEPSSPDVATEQPRPASFADMLRAMNSTAAGNASSANSRGGTETSESGASAGQGADVFPGITILAGGVGPTGVSPAPPESTVPETEPERSAPPGALQKSYGVTVLSTERGGGGLPDFDVFRNEQVQTVFFDMRRSTGDLAPVWTVEYGLPQGVRVQANPGDHASEIVEGILLPFPLTREQPAFSPALVARYPGQMVIAYALVSVDGKMEEITVRQSPDPGLVQPVLDALPRWEFRPATLDGAPVTVKILLGIPLWAPN